MRQKLTTADFIARTMMVHGKRYDYSEVAYAGSRVKVGIICALHGMFFQAPNAHLAGRGCPKCKSAQAVDSNKCDINHFLEKARQVHGEQYDYSNVEYISSKRKVDIICLQHGLFQQTPSVHYKSGCPLCSIIDVKNRKQIWGR